MKIINYKMKSNEVIKGLLSGTTHSAVSKIQLLNFSSIETGGNEGTNASNFNKRTCGIGRTFK